jgi:Galactose-1-phosphate uridylyltransferase
VSKRKEKDNKNASRFTIVNELRWDPVLEEWVIIASHRQERPIDSSICPFCPGKLDIPEDYEVLSIPNKFPSLTPVAPIEARSTLYRKDAANGFLRGDPVFAGSQCHFGRVEPRLNRAPDRFVARTI